MDVSVIIVSYNTKDLTIACLRSVYLFTKDVTFEVILVDNDSHDGSIEAVRELFPFVKVICLSENVGFGNANNIGAREATGKYLFLLNSDTELISNSIKRFYDYLELNTQYASCGCNLLDGKRSNAVCHGCLPTLKMDFFSLGLNKVFSYYYRNYLSEGQTIDYGNLEDTGYISGADIFIRKEVFDSLKGFDSNIFLYYEETDLFYRLSEKGLKSCILPDEIIIHYGGGSGGSISYQKVLMYEKSRLYFFRKHYTNVYVFIEKVVRLFNLLIRQTPDKKRLIRDYISL